MIFALGRISRISATCIQLFGSLSMKKGLSSRRWMRVRDSRIEGIAELPDLMTIAGRLGGGDGARYGAALAALTPEQRADLGADYIAETMAGIDAALPGHVHRVIYEDVVADVERETRALLAYLGLPFEPACLAFWRSDRVVRTPSSEQVRRPIFSDGLDQWRRFAPWLGPLRDALGDAIETYAQRAPTEKGALVASTTKESSRSNRAS